MNPHDDSKQHNIHPHNTQSDADDADDLLNNEVLLD